MIQHGFFFDSNRCTGCNACQLACTLENQLDFRVSWRQVVSFNPDNLPDQPVFHLSLACNHCADPACLDHCPARAYFKDPGSGHVLLDRDKCIGCRYCSWVCPYDAPVYDAVTGLVEKCTFCDTRYHEQREPACVALCPTGALKSAAMDLREATVTAAGLPESDLQPAVKVIPFRQVREPFSEQPLPFDQALLDRYRRSLHRQRKKITLRSEWSLMLFTFISAILIGDAVARIFSPGIFDPYLYLLLLGFSLGISLLHLGRKGRAFRAMLNWRNSWLSREILFYSVFSALITPVLLCEVSQPFPVLIAAGFGLAALFAMDQVYRILPGDKTGNWSSASVLLTAVLAASFITGTVIIFYTILAVKALLFFRFYSGALQRTEPLSFHGLAVIRIISGFILLPLSAAGVVVPEGISPGLFLLAEAADRVLFYRSIHIITPAQQMARDLETALTRKD